MKQNILSCNDAVQAGRLIDKYFTQTRGKYHIEQKTIKTGKDHVETIDQKVWDSPPLPATISGLAFFLGFNSRRELENYQHNGQFASVVQRAVLSIEATYEEALHQNATGAMFVLKSIGWNDKPEPSSVGIEMDNILKVQITDAGPAPAGNEKDVTL